MSDSNTYARLVAGATQFDVLRFFFRQQLAKVRVTTVVKVLAVTNDGDVSAVGFVDVQPLVQQVDGIGNTVNLPPIYNVPYLRIQGGTNAVILDPQVGDLGIAVFADRDISSVKSTKAIAAPGSNRRNDLADALYLGGILNGVPQQFLRFSADGIEAVSPTKIRFQAPNIEADASTQFKVVSDDIQLQGPVHITGAQTNDSTIDAVDEITGKGVHLSTHTQSGVTTGGGTSGPPVPGS